MPAKKDEKLQGLSGVFNAVNLNVYHYAGDNPVRLIDPDGNFLVATVSGTIIGLGVGVGSALLQGKEFGSKEFWGEVANSITAGLITGLAIDSVETCGATGALAAFIVASGGVVGGTVGYMIESQLTGREMSAIKAGISALIGGVSAYAGVKAGNAIVNKFEQKLFAQLKDKSSSLYKAIHTLEGGTEKMINIMKKTKFAQLLATRGADAGIEALSNQMQNLANKQIDKYEKK